jgi:hypothetical protein
LVAERQRKWDTAGRCRAPLHAEGGVSSPRAPPLLFVQSGYLEDPDWNNSTVLRGKVVDEVSKLKRCHGSAAKQVR